MLICFDCVKELKKEYLENIKKENKSKYIHNRHHSKIKRKLLDKDENSKISSDSYYTDNNSYLPYKSKYNLEEYKSDILSNNGDNNLNINRNLDDLDDKLSAYSYNSIVTDYSIRRKKNKKENDNIKRKDLDNNININNKIDKKKNDIKNDKKEYKNKKYKFYVQNDESEDDESNKENLNMSQEKKKIKEIGNKEIEKYEKNKMNNNKIDKKINDSMNIKKENSSKDIKEKINIINPDINKNEKGKDKKIMDNNNHKNNIERNNEKDNNINKKKNISDKNKEDDEIKSNKINSEDEVNIKSLNNTIKKNIHKKSESFEEHEKEKIIRNIEQKPEKENNSILGKKNKINKIDNVKEKKLIKNEEIIKKTNDINENNHDYKNNFDNDDKIKNNYDNNNLKSPLDFNEENELNESQNHNINENLNDLKIEKSKKGSNILNEGDIENISKEESKNYKNHKIENNNSKNNSEQKMDYGYPKKTKEEEKEENSSRYSKNEIINESKIKENYPSLEIENDINSDIKSSYKNNDKCNEEINDKKNSENDEEKFINNKKNYKKYKFYQDTEKDKNININKYNKNRDSQDINSISNKLKDEEDLSESNEKKSESEDIIKSSYYQKCKNSRIDDNSKFTYKEKLINEKNKNRKDKIIRNNLSNSSENDEEEEYSLKSSESIKYNRYEGENDNHKDLIIFNNRYIKNNNDQNYVTKKYYNDINKIRKNILYQDFYYKEVSYGSSISSLRSSINSKADSNYIDNDLKKSYPEDNKRGRIKRNENKNIEPNNEFDKYIFNQINIIRTAPESFIDKIESAKKNIKIDKRNNYIYKGNQKMLLNNGIYAFDNAIKHLKTAKSMNKLVYEPKMNIKLPSNEEEINDRKYQYNMVNDSIKDKFKIKSFWREVIKDPEECFLLMIIDDCGNNYGFKRKDILDPQISTIGINSVKIGKYFSCYIQLS